MRRASNAPFTGTSRWRVGGIQSPVTMTNPVSFWLRWQEVANACDAACSLPPLTNVGVTITCAPRQQQLSMLHHPQCCHTPTSLHRSTSNTAMLMHNMLRWAVVYSAHVLTQASRRREPTGWLRRSWAKGTESMPGWGAGWAAGRVQGVSRVGHWQGSKRNDRRRQMDLQAWLQLTRLEKEGSAQSGARGLGEGARKDRV